MTKKKIKLSLYYFCSGCGEKIKISKIDNAYLPLNKCLCQEELSAIYDFIENNFAEYKDNIGSISEAVIEILSRKKGG